jgi:Spy/CpxP family protein refolding chaperone
MMIRTHKIGVLVGTVVAVMSLGAMAIGAVYAQQPAPAPPPGQGQHQGMGGGGPMARGTMALHRGLAQLNLTDDQKTQIKGIVQAHRAEMQGIATQVRNARRALGDAVTNDADEATIRARAADLGKAEADLAVFGATLRKGIFAVLTPDQQAKAKALRLEALDRMGRFMGRRGKAKDDKLQG